MRIRVIRNLTSQDGAVGGEMTVNGIFECFTLERQAVMIPEGVYEVSIRWSPHFQRSLPHIESVPGRSGILIHPLNHAYESEGCIGVGQEHTVTSVEHSRLAMNHLQPQIASALARNERVTIEVTHAQPNLTA